MQQEEEAKAQQQAAAANKNSHHVNKWKQETAHQQVNSSGQQFQHTLQRHIRESNDGGSSGSET